MRSEIYERIEERLSAVGLSATRASVLAGLSQDAIRNIRRAAEQGRRASVNLSTLEKLAPVLQTSANWLATGTGQRTETGPRIRMIPLVSWVSAGRLTSTDWIQDPSEREPLPFADIPDGQWIALEVTGDSMDRISPPGSQILVNLSDTRLVPKAFYIVANAQGEATYKRYRPSPDRFEPFSTNTLHEPLFDKGELRIIGRVKRTILNM